MGICSSMVTVALTATLLGAPSLKLDRVIDVEMTECTAENQNENPNAVVSLKDKDGNTVFSQKIRVADFDFYLAGEKRGGVPAKDAVVLLNYPKTSVTERASSVELRMLSFPYQQSTRLPASQPPSAEVGLK